MLDSMVGIANNAKKATVYCRVVSVLSKNRASNSRMGFAVTAKIHIIITMEYARESRIVRYSITRHAINVCLDIGGRNEMKKNRILETKMKIIFKILATFRSRRFINEVWVLLQKQK